MAVNPASQPDLITGNKIRSPVLGRGLKLHARNSAALLGIPGASRVREARVRSSLSSVKARVSKTSVLISKEPQPTFRAGKEHAECRSGQISCKQLDARFPTCDVQTRDIRYYGQGVHFPVA